MGLPVGHEYLQALKVSFCREWVDDVLLRPDPDCPSFRGHALVVLSSLTRSKKGKAGERLRDEASKVSVCTAALSPEQVYRNLVGACRAYDALAE